jgi:hypothetical protein
MPMCIRSDVRNAETYVVIIREKPDTANVAELADAPDLGSGSRKGMGVRPSPFAPTRWAAWWVKKKPAQE